ncbi:hypothetical protein DFH08DRAFT_715892 [Mycena albidolilacea]|uniref:Uncharacterized protein n=1 Tax=Mycena albidolilacea TaxID=1033008 RepID=A0AAD7EE95_9AGAR|nr:hypothetical protein DFH08DRAFT_715892 [Mycena albidolilacea]
MIPRAECEGSQREVLTHATTFDDALDIIYRTVGCTDIGKKPVLMYKLSTATTKVNPISLASQADWDGCLDEVTAAEGKKKVNVNILVTEQYLLSLRTKLGIKSGVPAKSKGSKNRIPILDLEHAQSGEDDFDDGLGIMEKERNWIQQLQAKYTKCQLCGPTKSCKIDISGNHHNLSNNQLRAWAHSLAVGTHNVTLVTPPHDGLFSMFFKNSHGPAPSTSAPPGPFPSFAPYLAMNSMNPYGFMPPWGMHFPGNPTTPITPTPVPQPRSSPAPGPSKLAAAFASSDPPDMGMVNPYPEITDFLHELDGYQPKRHLLDYIDKFNDLDFYNIDEIGNLKTPQVLVDTAGISLGNATYILTQVKAEMKRVDRARRLTA